MKIASKILNKMPAKWILKIKNINHHDQEMYHSVKRCRMSHMNGLLNRNHRIISTDVEKEIDKIYKPFMIKA